MGNEFQPSPNLKAGCNAPARMVIKAVFRVSTLTQPQGRVQPRHLAHRLPMEKSFNPHPTSRPGATVGGHRSAADGSCFNPHPTSRPGATKVSVGITEELRVSTLTQPQGRVQLVASISLQSHTFVSTLTQPQGRVQHFQA